MTTANGFFDNLKRVAGDAASKTWDRASGVFEGLRGQASAATDYVKNAVNPGAAASAEEQAAKSTVQSAQRMAATGMEPGPAGLRSTPDAIVARAADPVGRSGPSTGQMIKNASQYTPRGLGGFLAKTGRALPAVTPLVEAGTAAMNIADGENPVKAIGRGLVRGGMTVAGGLGGAALGTLGAPGVGTLLGGAAGGTAGYRIGDAVSDSLFGPAPDGQPDLRKPVGGAAAPVAAPVAAPRNANSVMTGRSSMTDGDSLNGQRIPLASENADARPQAIISEPSLNPAPGYGAIQRTGNLNPDGSVDRSTAKPAVALGNGLGSQPVQTAQAGQSAAAGGSANGLREVPTVQGRGLTKFKADVRNQHAATEARSQDVTRENNAIARTIQLAQMQRTNENDRQEQVVKSVDDYVRAKNPAVKESLVPGSKAQADYEAGIKQKGADLHDRLRHTASVTPGVGSLGRVSESQQTLLHKANDFRERLETTGRSGVIPWAQDFFGNKRFDSKNLYSYLPARDDKGAVKPAIPETFGYSVEMGNGNRIKVYKLGGGGFNFTGPNDPIDADAMELIKPAIDASRTRR